MIFIYRIAKQFHFTSHSAHPFNIGLPPLPTSLPLVLPSLTAAAAFAALDFHELHFACAVFPLNLNFFSFFLFFCRLSLSGNQAGGGRCRKLLLLPDSFACRLLLLPPQCSSCLVTPKGANRKNSEMATLPARNTSYSQSIKHLGRCQRVQYAGYGVAKGEQRQLGKMASHALNMQHVQCILKHTHT